MVGRHYSHSGVLGESRSSAPRSPERALFNEVGGYDPDSRFGEDLDRLCVVSTTPGSLDMMVGRVRNGSPLAFRHCRWTGLDPPTQSRRCKAHPVVGAGSERTQRPTGARRLRQSKAENQVASPPASLTAARAHGDKFLAVHLLHGGPRKDPGPTTWCPRRATSARVSADPRTASTSAASFGRRNASPLTRCP